MSKPRSLFGPLLLIGAGTIWLLVKSGNIPVSNLWALTYVWPFVLIAAGLGLILRTYWEYANLLLDVVIIGGLVFAILFAPSLGWNNPSMTTFVFDDQGFVGPSEPGSGNVIIQTRDVAAFHAIKVDYPAQVIVTQGSSASVKVEAEDNLLTGLQTLVRNGTLEISYNTENGKRVNPTKPVILTIVVKELNEISLDSASELKLTGVESDKLRISVSGAGNLELKGINIGGLSADLSGASRMVASGTANDFNLSISGFGSFDGQDLHSKTASVEMSGTGRAIIWVDDELDAQISGAGSINYYGSPLVTRHVSGLGSVNRLGSK
jgi:hypothetical protein